LDANGVQRVTDINKVIASFGAGPGPDCPQADVQVAKATQAIYNDADVALLLACNEAEYASRGYLRASTNVPGQGIHYFNAAYWDGTFNPLQPEGLVCKATNESDPYSTPAGLAALLYVVNGDYAGIGWNGWTAGSGPISGVDIDTFCSPSPCSWDAAEGWHAHANLCTYHIGTQSAVALPGVGSQASCDGYQSGTPCPAPGTSPAGCPGTHTWNDQVGWMGHLWNIVPNENVIPDIDSQNNGRYADCRPPFKHNSCPM
jgi:hypothetical protein